MRICLYGSGSSSTNSKYTEVSYKLGQEIAERGYELVFGGGDTGVMGAVSKGVIENHGKVFGIAPEWMKEFEGMCKDCFKFIHTSTMDERKNLFLKHSDAFIVAPGGIGTLDEFFEIFTLKKLKRHNKKIVVFNIEGYYDTMLNMIDFMIDQGTIPKDNKNLFHISTSIEDIFNYLEDAD
ncbi:Rossman fold protein, TIGR00730 family [Methanobrevibacter sp. 87.7]|uniref:LOG family protein n=1 Tax=Methanobrevibacter sp. 87.7 TaxID=387957 RepID=UPI000B50467A|nr:TIGR00730 family Rossman fold protein [Methanobrevibacter sp. 87.7]OWT32423.1 Rossman fold protein, TIGR00730 family [Methanobrevibacter sp. 87.7]